MKIMNLIPALIMLVALGAQANPNNILFTKIARPLHTPLVAPLTNPQGQPQLLYYGGPVIANVRIVAVFWTSSVDATVQSKIGNFYGAMTNSSYFDFLKEYDTDLNTQAGQPGTNQQIGRGSFVGNYVIAPAKTTGTIDDTDVQAELAKQIKSGNLPPEDKNTLYMVHFPPGVTITLNQGGSIYTSCQDFCAYHSAYKDGNNDLYYGVMPDFNDGGCSQGCGNGDNFSNFTSAASHEVTEAVTDPQVGYVTTSLGAPLAWYDPDQGEIGDICVGTNGTVKATDGTAFNVQGVWSNSADECVQAAGVAATGTPGQ